MIARPTVPALLVILAGCGPATVGNSTSVIVADGTNQNRAFALAEQHCAQYGKLARFNRMEGQRGAFDCVKD